MSAIRRAMIEGFKATSGFAIGAVMFGVVFGSTAVSVGMPMDQSMVMSVIAFAGAAQFAVLPLWAHPLPWAAIAISVALVSTRNVLMGLSLSAEFRKAPWPLRLLAIHTLVDASWALAMRHKGRAELAAFYCGSSLTLYASWLIGVVAGNLLPELLDPVTVKALGFGGIIFLSLVLVMLAKNRIGPQLPWMVSAVVAVILSHHLAPHLVLLGAVGAGALFSMLFRRRRGA